MIFFILQHNGSTKRGWCHGNNNLEDALDAVMYQSGKTLQELQESGSFVRFLYRDSVDLGTYRFNDSEFFPSSLYINNPKIANLYLL